MKLSTRSRIEENEMALPKLTEDSEHPLRRVEDALGNDAEGLVGVQKTVDLHSKPGASRHVHGECVGQPVDQAVSS